MITKDKKKSNRELTNYEKKLQKKKQNEDLKKQKEAVKETNKNIQQYNKWRRELGQKITLGSIEELIPFNKVIDRGKDGIELCGDFGYLDVVRVISFDYSAMDDDELNSNEYHWDRYYRTMARPIKKLSLNMPVDTSQQVNFFKEKLKKATNPLYQEKLKKVIKELQTEFNDRETREYFMFYYADNLDSLREELSHIRASLETSGLIITMSPMQKLELINKLSNPFTNKEMLTDNFTDID